LLELEWQCKGAPSLTREEDMLLRSFIKNKDFLAFIKDI
jgi:hypothetical protein